MADLMNRSRGSDRRPMTFVGSSGRRFDPVAILPMERMRRLRVDQPVGVSLDGEAAIECDVSSLLGPVATLRRPGQLRADVRRMLTHGSLGFLVFDYGGAPVALRGVARAVPDSLAIEFVVIDGIQVAERRTAARTALVARVRLTELRCEETERAALDTSTVDLSLGGRSIRT